MKSFKNVPNHAYNVRFPWEVSNSQDLLPNLDSILNQALQNTSEYLSNFRNDAAYSQKLETAFGSDFDTKKADKLFNDFAKEKFKDLPTIEIVSRNDINGANGAFSITTGKIYLAAEFIDLNANNVDAITSVLLEEFGHFVDAEINVVDAPGDEGDIFSRLVQGDSLSESELGVLRAENDSATVTLDGKEIGIEQNQGNVTFAPQKVALSDFSVDRGWSSFDKYPRQLADVNGDGRADIVAFGEQNVFVALGQADGKFGTKITAKNDFFTVKDGGWSSFHRYPRQVADVNGDGRADIIGFGYHDVFVALGQADGKFGTNITALSDFSVNRGWSSFDKYPRQLADVNGDGRADIVAFGEQNVFVALGQADGKFGTKITALSDFSVNRGWSSFDKYPRQLADVNGDGRADIVAFGDDHVFVALGQADGKFGTKITAKNDFFTVKDGGWSSFDRYPRQVADVNGDGRADIIGFGYHDVFVALGQADGKFGTNITAKNDFFTVEDGVWSSFDRYPRQVADINGDGSADIVGFGPDNVYVALAESGNDGGTSDYILGGYIGSWNLDSSTLVDATFNKLTHLFYSFADVRPDGTVTLPNDWYSWDRSTNDGTKLQEIKAQNPNLKIMLSIGGALEGDFSSAVGDNSTSTTRTNFVNSAINLMNQHGFDGIDIDWETPKHTENPEYIDLLDKLDQALPAGKLLTTATMASQWYLEGTGDYKLAADLNWNGTTKSVLAHTSDIVDFINVMSYDYKATWAADTTTGHQAALGTTNEVNTVAWAVDYYLNKGVDSKDIVMGLPLYGRNWTGVNAGANNGLNMTGTPTLNDGTPYSELHTRLNNNEYEYFWDDSAKVPYLYNSQTKEFFTYEDTRSIGAKTDYVKDLGLGGAFFWEIPGDLPITHSDSLINAAATNLASII